MLKLILVIAFVLFLIIAGPILTLWSLNTLFPALAIPYTFETWLAVVLLGSLMKSRVSVSK